MRRVASLAALALLLPAVAGAPPRGGAIVAFVASPPSLLFVGSGNELAATVSVAPGPTAVAASVDGRVVLVVSPPAGALTVVDGRDRAVLAVVHGFRRPVDVALAPDGRHAFVADAGGRSVAVVDLVRRRIASRVDVPAPPRRLTLHDSELWVTFGPRSGAPALLDVTQPTQPRLIGRVHLGGAVRSVTFAGDGLHAYAVFWGARLTRLWALSFRRSAVTGRQLEAPVTAIAVDVLGRVWTANGRRLSVRSPRSLAVVRTLQLQAPVRRLVATGGFVLALTTAHLTTIDIVSMKRVAAAPVLGGTGLAVAVE